MGPPPLSPPPNGFSVLGNLLKQPRRRDRGGLVRSFSCSRPGVKNMWACLPCALPTCLASCVAVVTTNEYLSFNELSFNRAEHHLVVQPPCFYWGWFRSSMRLGFPLCIVPSNFSLFGRIVASGASFWAENTTWRALLLPSVCTVAGGRTYNINLPCGIQTSCRCTYNSTLHTAEVFLRSHGDTAARN